MATTMPCSTPSRITPSGRDEREHQRRSAAPASSGAARARSTSDSAAAMTTAASAVCGRSASSELRNSSSTTTSPAPTTPVELALGARLLGDRGARAAGRDGEALEEPGGDVGARRCRSSPGWARPRRRGGPRSSSTVAIVSVSDTSVMPTAASSSGPTSPTRGPRARVGVGQPLRQRADRRHAVRRRGRTRRRRPWRRRPRPAPRARCGVTRGSTSSTTQHADARRRAPSRRVWSRCVDEGPDLVDEAVGVGREPEQLGQLADDDRDRQAVHVADLDLAWRAGRRRTRACRARARSRSARRAAPASRRARSRVPGSPATEQRRDRGEDQRRDRRVGAEHEHPRRPEDRVADQAGDRRVEAGDRRAARRARRTPCPGARGSRRARARPRGRPGAMTCRSGAAGRAPGRTGPAWRGGARRGRATHLCATSSGGPTMEPPPGKAPHPLRMRIREPAGSARITGADRRTTSGPRRQRNCRPRSRAGGGGGWWLRPGARSRCGSGPHT